MRRRHVDIDGLCPLLSVYSLFSPDVVIVQFAHIILLRNLSLSFESFARTTCFWFRDQRTCVIVLVDDIQYGALRHVQPCRDCTARQPVPVPL